MKKIILCICIIALGNMLHAQDDIYPAKKQNGLIIITNATVHVGNGQILDNTNLEIQDGKITKIGNFPISTNDITTIMYTMSLLRKA